MNGYLRGHGLEKRPDGTRAVVFRAIREDEPESLIKITLPVDFAERWARDLLALAGQAKRLNENLTGSSGPPDTTNPKE